MIHPLLLQRAEVQLIDKRELPLGGIAIAKKVRGVPIHQQGIVAVGISFHLKCPRVAVNILVVPVGYYPRLLLGMGGINQVGLGIPGVPPAVVHHRVSVIAPGDTRQAVRKFYQRTGRACEWVLQLEQLVAILGLHRRVAFIQRFRPREGRGLVGPPVNMPLSFEGSHEAHRQVIQQGLLAKIHEEIPLHAIDIGFVRKAVIGYHVRKGTAQRGEQQVATVGREGLFHMHSRLFPARGRTIEGHFVQLRGHQYFKVLFIYRVLQ